MATEGLLQVRLEAGPDVPVPHQAQGGLVHPQPAEQVGEGQAHRTALLDRTVYLYVREYVGEIKSAFFESSLWVF